MDYRGGGTTGPYSGVRHPLYTGNLLCALGLAMFPHTWMAPPLMALIAAGYYACIAVREDEDLRGRFGARFETWASRVPAFVPCDYAAAFADHVDLLIDGLEIAILRCVPA